MKILFLTTALLAMTTAQAQSATPTANDAQYQQKIEQVFRGAELDRSIQVYPKAELATWDREKAAGGEGALLGQFAYTRKQTNEKDAFREIGWLTLPPGASIGLHKHDNNEDVYIIISGQRQRNGSQSGRYHHCPAGTKSCAEKRRRGAAGISRFDRADRTVCGKFGGTVSAFFGRIAAAFA